MNTDRIPPTPDPWADYFDAQAVASPMPAEAPADPREPAIASVMICFEDGTFLARLPDGAEVLAVNDIFPLLAPGHPVVLYPAAAGGWSLVNPAWYVPVARVTLRHVRMASRMDPDEFNVRVQRASLAGLTESPFPNQTWLSCSMYSAGNCRPKPRPGSALSAGSPTATRYNST